MCGLDKWKFGEITQNNLIMHKIRQIRQGIVICKNLE